MIYEQIGGVVILLFMCWLGYGAYLMVMDSEKRFQERKKKDKDE